MMAHKRSDCGHPFFRLSHSRSRSRLHIISLGPGERVSLAFPFLGPTAFAVHAQFVYTSTMTFITIKAEGEGEGEVAFIIRVYYTFAEANFFLFEPSCRPKRKTESEERGIKLFLNSFRSPSAPAI